MLNTTQEQMKEEVLNEINNNGEDLDEIRDNSGEWVDNYVPIYNNQVIKEWQEMPSEYDDRGAQELGINEDATIINRMTLDLYLYYSDLFAEVLDEVEEELEEKETANA
jgi:hypothetical protein